MTSFETLLYEKREGIACITLNRPQALNTINLQMRDELWQVLPAVNDDPEVLVAILKGAGDRAFSAGADITEFGTAPSQAIARQVRWERDLWGTLLKMEKPLIAAIHGYALGAGIELALCCDLRIASEDARFGLPEVALGMIPSAGGTQTLPRTVRLGPASFLALTGEMVDAAEAYRLGLVHRVVNHPQLLPTAEETAQRVMACDQAAVRLCKEALNRGLDLSLEQGLELETELLALLLGAKKGGRMP